MGSLLDEHSPTLAKHIADGRVVPFLGAGVNLFGLTSAPDWRPGERLPSGGELARHLAKQFLYPQPSQQPNEPPDLLRVSQYAWTRHGSGPLYEELHGLFAGDYRPTPLHDFFAGLPAVLRAKGSPSPFQLIVTTNYDDLLERAFDEAGEPFDLVYYASEGELPCRFWHRPHDAAAHPIETNNDYRGLPIDERGVLGRTVIFKVHGAVDRASVERSSFVITEDDYIDFLARLDPGSPLPVQLALRLRRSHLLFLGYSLGDWNLRVILRRIWAEQRLKYNSWAIQLKPETLDERLWEFTRELWRNRNVTLVNARIEDCIAQLHELVRALPNRERAVE